MNNPMDMSGKLFIVTGASGGIGTATARKLSELGAKIILISRDIKKLNTVSESLDGDNHRCYSYDFSVIDGIEELVETIVAENGPVDGLVHCAGVSPMVPVKSTKYDILHRTMLINFYAFTELIRNTAKAKNCREGSSFVAVSSVSSVKGNKAQSAYAASKAALNGIVKPMAKELSSRKIRVNSVLFGMIGTSMYDNFIAGGGDKTLWKDQYLGIGETADAANVIAFLLSGASKLITGSNIIADCGYLS